MPKCNCTTCEHSCLWKVDEHYPEHTFCTKKMTFVEDNHVCDDWENNSMSSPIKMVGLAIISIILLIILQNFS